MISPTLKWKYPTLTVPLLGSLTKNKINKKLNPQARDWLLRNGYISEDGEATLNKPESPNQEERRDLTGTSQLSQDKITTSKRRK